MIATTIVEMLMRMAPTAGASTNPTGARTPAGMPEPKEGIQTLVFTKQAGRWLIAAFQNTHSAPERPFPAAPSERDTSQK